MIKLKKDNCIYCNKIYNSQHVRFCLYDNLIIDNSKTINDHEQECKTIFEEKEKNEIILTEVKLLENELAKKCSVDSIKYQVKNIYN